MDMRNDQDKIWRLTVHMKGMRKLSKDERIRNTRTYNNIATSSVESILDSIDKEGYDVTKHELKLMPI